MDSSSLEISTPKTEKRPSKTIRSRNASLDASSSVESTIKRKVSMNAVLAAVRMGDRRRSSSNTPGEDVAKSEPDMLKTDTLENTNALSPRSPVGLGSDVIYEEDSNSSIPSQSRRGSTNRSSTNHKSARRTSARGSVVPTGIPVGFFPLDEDYVSAPDLSYKSCSPITTNISNVSSEGSSPLKNKFADSDESLEKATRDSGNKRSETLAEILSDRNFGPQGFSDIKKAEVFKSEPVKLMEAIPKLVQVTVDRGFVVISEIEMIEFVEVSTHRISHGACLAILSNRDKSLEIIHKNGRVRILAPSIEITMAIVCEINTATSKAAAQRGMSSTFDKPKVADANIESYRLAMRSLRSRLDMPSLEDIVSMREIEYDNPTSPVVGKAFNLSQTSLLARTSQGELGKNREYEVASKEEEAKYKVAESRDDILQKVEFLLSSDELSSVDRKPGVLMKHLSNSSLEMVVRYEVNPDGTFTHAIGAATLPKLIERLADEEPTDAAFTDIFLHTFRHYTTVEDVLDKLTRRISVRAPDDANAEEIGFMESWASVIKIK